MKWEELMGGARIYWGFWGGMLEAWKLLDEYIVQMHKVTKV